MAISVIERDKISGTRIHIRGSVHTLGDVVPRGFLRVASYGPTPTMPDHESGRRELADWLASPRNPLTARVIVNRAWHWLLGAGLVRTVDNFGTTGETPSHPELLDHLALRFMNEGWSIKSLVRQLVLSRAYRLSSLDDPHARSIDPENRLLWHHNRRRLEAEELRDTILSVSGRLNTTMGGLSFPADLADDYAYKDDSDAEASTSPSFATPYPSFSRSSTSPTPASSLAAETPAPLPPRPSSS